MKFSIIACTAVFLQSGAFAQSPAPAVAATTSQAASGVNSYTPMTQGQQFHHFARSTFSFEAVVRAAAGAAILQALNTPSEWGQGGVGYARRFGNDYAQHIGRQVIIYGMSDLLGEDNRYFASGLAGMMPRMRYAIASTFLARKSDGHRRISYSRIAGVVAVGFISREWEPSSTDHVHNALLSIATVFGSEAGFNVAREFLPKLFHTRNLR